MTKVLSDLIHLEESMWKLAACLVLFLMGTSNGENLRCITDFYNHFDSCQSMWGYDNSASLDYDAGDLFNFTQLIQYCRTPNRMNVFSCISGAYAICTEMMPEDEASFFSLEQNKLLSLSVDYLCMNDRIIEQSLECLERVGGEITACARNAIFEYDRELRRIFSDTSESITWDTKKFLKKRMGHDKEMCVVELLESNCTTPVKNVMGNFFYANGVYPYN